MGLYGLLSPITRIPMNGNGALGGGYEVNESVEVLLNAWRTEMNAPEILPYRDELVKEMKSLLSAQEVIIHLGNCNWQLQTV